jgi:hypothetical protein
VNNGIGVFARALFVSILSLGFLSLLFSSSEACAEFEGPAAIRADGWQVSGSFSYLTSSTGSTFSVQPSTEYFVIDGLSIGGEVSYLDREYADGQQGAATYGIGPSLTYYFLPQDVWSPFIHQAFQYSHSTSGGDDSRLGTTSLGARFFLNDHVAVGMSAQSQYGSNMQNIFSIVGGFTIFL